ncbi:MAG TPA: FeoB-associated Cys-rich membrane protein [Clostridiales bacterium]|nr:FeoB-associated Cys-rich membrane protein [Clostridiales bacterium]
MLTFLAQNLATIVVGIILLAIVVLIIRKLIKDKKSGKSCSSCPGNCQSCPGTIYDKK